MESDQKDARPRIADSSFTRCTLAMTSARARVNIRKNGESSGGFRVAFYEDDGWSNFLSACSEKLGIEVARVFTSDGFRVDELKEIEPGETLICSSGEDFIAAPSLMSMMSSNASLSSLTTDPAACPSTPVLFPADPASSFPSRCSPTACVVQPRAVAKHEFAELNSLQ